MYITHMICYIMVTIMGLCFPSPAYPRRGDACSHLDSVGGQRGGTRARFTVTSDGLKRRDSLQSHPRGPCRDNKW